MCVTLLQVLSDSPDAVEDEEELYEDTAEGEDAAHQRGRDRMGEPVLVGNLTRYLVCLHWLLYWLGATHDN